MLRKLPDYGMEIWDKQTCTRVTIGLISENDLYRKRIYFFKGMEIYGNGALNLNWRGILINGDFYGLDTKKRLILIERQ